MKTVTRAAALAALSLSGVSHAEPYAALSGTLSEYEYGNSDLATGIRLTGGYALGALPLRAELAYVSTGDADINGNSSLSFDGVNASVAYAYTLTRRGSAVWIKAGFYAGDSTYTSAITVDGKDSTSGASWGFGGEWKFTPQVGLRFDYENLVGVKDLPRFNPNHESDLTQSSLGLVWHFGMAGATSRAAAPALPPAPAPEPAAAAAPAPAMPMPSSPAPVAAPPPAAGPVTIVTTTLRAQPKSHAANVLLLPAGTPVSIRGAVTNVEGQWLYISVGGRVGWLPVNEVETPR